MFKLLAIRPLEGCADYIQKCLKTGMMYYFCNDYIIEPGSHIRRRSKNIKPLKEDFFTVVSESDYSEDNSSERKSPTVSVSAIVGMNGDGKSTLVELMMRLINNCAISYELCASSDNGKGENGNKTEPHYNLRRVKNAKAELYYMIDNVVYRMAEEKDQKETRIWKVSELNPFNEKGEELMRWEIDSVKIQKVEDDPKGFFFTIVSNYSHYAYNIYDYEKEWEIRGGEKDDDEKCWLHYVFHKNDGYLTPITLHPYRYKGNIDINVEKDLSKQRLLSLFLNAENPSENKYSFRRVNGKDANILKLTEEKESKLQQKAIVEYFNTENQTNRYKELLDEIDIANEILVASMLMDSDEVYNKDYYRLLDTLDNTFLNPITQIIKQDKDFIVFSNEVAEWMKTKYKTRNNKTQYNGDIITVIKHYEKQFYRNNTITQIYEYTQKAMKSIEEGDYAMALEQFEKALGISETDLDKEHIFTALIHNDIAVAYDYLGDYDNALHHYKESIRIKEKKMGDEHLSTTTTYGNMAGLYKANDEYETAKDCCTKALPIVTSSANPLLMIKTYNNMALVFEEMEEFGAALEYDNMALNVIKENNMDENPLAISNYINTARVLMAKGERQDAIVKYRNALQISQRLISQASSNNALLYDSIAWAYLGMDNPNKALDNFKFALNVRKNTFGLEHIEIATSYDNIAWTNVAIKKYQDAIDNFRVALRVRENILGNSNKQIVSSCNNIAWALYKNGDYSESIEEYKTVLKKVEKITNTNPLDIAAIFYNIAGVYVIKGGLGAYKKALDYYQKALDNCSDILGKDHPNIATIYNNMALVHMKKSDYGFDNAYVFFKKALEIRKNILGENHLDVATIYNNIAILFKKRGNHNKALDNYEKALHIMKEKLGERNRDTAFYYIKIAWEYYDMGNNVKALDNFNSFFKNAEISFGPEDTDTIQYYYHYYYSILASLYKQNGDYDKAWECHNKALKKEKINMDENRPDVFAINMIIKDVHHDDDKRIQSYEEEEMEKQLIPKNRRSEARLGKGEMEKFWESNDAAKRIRNMKNQELIDTNKYNFLKTVNAAKLGRLDTLYRIIKAYNDYYKKYRDKEIKTEIVTKSYSELTLKERCQHYIIYKIWSVLSTYPQYQKAKKKDSVASIREFGSAMEESVKDILNDKQSHITRKIRQVENFMNEGVQKGGLYERLGNKEKKSGALLVELDRLKEYYKDKSFSLDQLPPPIYKWDIIFNKKDDSNCNIELDSFSSGEKQKLNSIGAIIYHLQNLNHTASKVKYNNVNLIMEEIELYYHPEYQRQFFKELLIRIKGAELGNIQNINIVFVTHSPFILSDIPKCNVLFLKDGMPDDELQENTFGANIHSLLKHGFFMPNLPIGEFAYEKINALFKKLNTGDFNNDDEEKRKKELNDIYQQILLVGEPFLRNQLLLLYNSFKGSK